MIIKWIYKKFLTERTRILIRTLIIKCKYPFYLGNNFLCPICNKSFRRFLSKGSRTNATCPFCLSLERNRVLFFYLQKELKLFQKSNCTLLHFAPEPCLKNEIKKSKIDYYDGDINPSYATHVLDITNINFSNDHFDYIICSHVLAHVPNQSLALNELYRVLKPNGILILMTYIQPEIKCNSVHEVLNYDEIKLIFGQSDVYHLHGSDFGQLLVTHNFKVNEIDYRLNFSTFDQVKFVLGNGLREKLFVCTK